MQEITAKIQKTQLTEPNDRFVCLALGSDFLPNDINTNTNSVVVTCEERTDDCSTLVIKKAVTKQEADIDG